MAALKGVSSVVVVMAVLSAIVLSSASAQELAPAPSPSMDKGAAYSFGVSAAVICSSLFLSALAFFKH